MATQAGFFDVDERLRRLSDLGDQLEVYGRTVDFELFRLELDAALAYSDGTNWHRPVGRFRRASADHDLGRDKALAALACARPRHPQRPARSQAGRQFAAQRPSALNEEHLIDGFIRHSPFGASSMPRMRLLKT